MLGDSGADYTSTANYGTIEDGILRVNFTNGDYDLIELTETGFDISYYENESLVGSPTSVTSELVDYTADELSFVLADVAPVFTNELVSGKVYYPNDITNSENKLEFYSNGVLKAYHTYNTENGPVNEPWGNGGDWMITSDGKLRTAFGEGTCYQFEISSVHGEGNISVSTTSDLTCNKASEMDEFNSDSIYTSLSFAETLTEGNIGTPSTFELTTGMISGKQIYISDENGTFLGKFYSNGTYSEVWDDKKSGGNSGTCTGTWEVSAFLNIYKKCSDSLSNEMETLVFNKQPATGVTFNLNVAGETVANPTITTISNIEETSTGGSTDTSTFTLTTAMLDNKVLYFKDSGFTSLTFGAYDSNVTAGSFYEYTHDTGDSPIACYGDWALDSTKANTLVIDNMCTGDSNYSTMYITFTSEPKAGTTVTYDDGQDTGSSPIFAVENSFVSGKKIVATDEWGTVTSTFNANGTYSEVGTDKDEGPWSCSGLWADLGDYKIGMTCDDNGTSEVPDGIIDPKSNEIGFQFNSATLKSGDTFTAKDYEEEFELTIDSITNL